jgi:lipoprotein-releasing system permease protein
MLRVGYRLREIIYLASLLGEARPALGYWLVTAALVVGLFLGINAGFVATASGRLDLRASYELFIANRHVSVFRPRLLAGIGLVLLTLVVAPLLVWAIFKAVGNAVARTRIKHLGLREPLAAAEALQRLKEKSPSPTATMTALAVGGVGVGVMALIIVLSVMSGFEADLQKKILGTNSHGVVLKYSPEMPEYLEVMTKVKQVRGVKGVTPFILNEVMVSSEGNISGSMIKGIDPTTVGSVTDLPEYVLPGGKLEWLAEPEKISARRLTGLSGFDDRPATPDLTPPPAKREEAGPSELARDPMLELPSEASAEAVVLPGILLGRELASSLKVVVGDRVNVVSPVGGELGPQGPMPKSRPFRVAGIFYSGMYEYDSKFVYIRLEEAQSFFNVKGATGIEVKVDDVDNARSTMKAIYDTLEGYPYRTKDWGEMNRNLFAALRLEKLVMGIILSMIVIVAAGLIVATVIMLVLEKRKEIAVLKALGVPDGGIVKIFLTEGLQIGVAGGLLGLFAGLAWCFFLEKVGIKLDPQVYYIPALPVRIEPFQTALSVVIAILVTFLASISPALKASEVEPVDGLKSE